MSLVGRRVRVYFEADQTWYAGSIVSTSHKRGVRVEYDPVEGEDDLASWHDLAAEKHEFIDDASAPAAAAASKKHTTKQPAPSAAAPPAAKRPKLAGKAAKGKAPVAAVVDSDDDVEEVEAPLPRPRACATGRAARDRPGKTQAAVEEDDDDDDDVVEVAPPPRDACSASGSAAASTSASAAASTSASAAASTSAAAAAAAAADDDDDDDVTFVGRTGALALVDFPHARENCAQHLWKPGSERTYCENCYCFVCDIPASTCREWEQHCKATHSSPQWQQKRDQKKARKSGAGGAGPSSSTYLPPWQRPHVTRWSCDELLRAVQVVYPVEEPEPPGLVAGTQLRPYQKQSLAFMLAIERGGTAAQAASSSSSSSAADVRGGWLADEVGMGKTLVVTSLIFSAPANNIKPIKDAEFQRFLKLRDNPPPDGDVTLGPAAPERDTLDFKCTIVVVNNTLVQQWADELKKYAPSLEVQWFFGSSQNKAAAWRRLRQCDVLLMTPHMVSSANMPDALLQRMRVHRLVVDESHLLAEASMGSKLLSLLQLRTRHVWLVSGTPFSTSLDQLKKQASLLRMSESFRDIHQHYTPNEDVAAWLRARMIRHTKGMRIGGEVALALPEADCQTVLLDMSEDERLLYGMHECVGGHALRLHDARSRFKAAAHVYDPEVVCGQSFAVRDDFGHQNPLRPPKHTIEAPRDEGSCREATAAFLRRHGSVEVVSKLSETKGANAALFNDSVKYDKAKGCYFETSTEYHARAMTKHAALIDDLRQLQEHEPDFRAVVFTRFDEVQHALVRLVRAASKPGGALHASGGAGGVDAGASSSASSGKGKAPASGGKAAAAAGKVPELKIFEFNKTTAPQARHKRISEFQNSSAPGARVFIVTVQTAAVGITLTAATRVYLMEPMPDPAQEVQAAGRIHRLGQTRDIFIRRYCFRDSIEEAVCAMHAQIRAGAFRVVDGKFPPEAEELFERYGPAASLFRPCGQPQSKVVEGEGLLDWGDATRRPAAKDAKGKLVRLQPSRWKRSCTEEECKLCSIRRVAPGSSRWQGTGIFGFLDGDTRDPPRAGQGVGAFKDVPAPPAGWMAPFRFKEKRELINTRAERDKEDAQVAEERRARTVAANTIDLLDSDDEGTGPSGQPPADAEGRADGDGDGSEGGGDDDDDDDFECASQADVTAGESDELVSDDECIEEYAESEMQYHQSAFAPAHYLLEEALGGTHSLYDARFGPHASRPDYRRELTQGLRDIYNWDASDSDWDDDDLDDGDGDDEVAGPSAVQAGGNGDEDEDDDEDEDADDEEEADEAAVEYSYFLSECDHEEVVDEYDHRRSEFYRA